MTIFGLITEILIGYIVGLMSFWTDEVDGIMMTLDRVRKFCAGGYFPLSLLPPIAGAISTFLPFAYTFYVPAQLYLGNISLMQGLKGLLIQCVWIILLSFLSRFVWKRGLRRFEGIGL